MATGPNQVWSWDITKLRRPAQVDLVPPLRDPRRPLPLRRRLARRHPRIRPARRRAHRRRHLRTARPRRPARPARRPRVLDDLQDRRPAPRRPRRAANRTPGPTSVQRQPVQRIPVQDPQVLPDVPETLHRPRPRPSVHATGSSSTTTTTTATPASGSTPPPTSTTAEPTPSGLPARTVLDAAYAARPERFRRPPERPEIPEATWINPPEEPPITAIAV